MRRVHLLTTGKCERKALHLSLKGLFGDVAEFVPIKGDTNSFTSSFIGDAPAEGLQTLAQKFANELVATMDAADRDDLVVGVDDLELENMTRPDAVVGLVRRSVQTAMARYQGSAAKTERLQQALRERCSFHLLVPMLEAYFFGEPAALVRAGAKRPAKFDASKADIEQFLIEDPDFTSVPDCDDSNRERRKQSWARPGRERHPKLYMKFLCDPQDPDGGSYRETHEGAQALGSLAWSDVLAVPVFAQFGRALVLDLAHALDVAPPVGGTPALITSTAPPDAVLRNL